MRMFVQLPLTSYLNMGALGGIETDYREQLGIAAEDEQMLPARCFCYSAAA